MKETKKTKFELEKSKVVSLTKQNMKVILGGYIANNEDDPKTTTGGHAGGGNSSERCC